MKSVSIAGTKVRTRDRYLVHECEHFFCHIVGGVISPLLANIALHAMEEALGIKHRKRGELNSKRAVVRYADNFCVFCENQEDAESVKHILTDWLSKR